MYPHTRVPDSKDGGRPWYRGYGTIQETGTGYQSTPGSKDNHDGRKDPPPWASILTLQSIEEVPQLKGVDTEWLPQPRFEFGVAFS